MLIERKTQRRKGGPITPPIADRRRQNYERRLGPRLIPIFERNDRRRFEESGTE